MQLTRRNALIGMGTVAAGAGVIGGTGAFTSVEADRTVDVSTSGDAGAALRIRPAKTTDGEGNTVATPNALEYTNANGPNGFGSETIEINPTGLNVDAKTTLENLFTLYNGGTNDVVVDFWVNNIPNDFKDISVLVGSDSYSLNTSSSGAVPDSAGNDAVTIEAGTLYEEDFGMEFDVSSETSGSYEITLTIRAQDNS